MAIVLLNLVLATATGFAEALWEGAEKVDVVFATDTVFATEGELDLKEEELDLKELPPPPRAITSV